MENTRLVLVDQDGVLADFDAGFNLAWSGRFPEREVVRAHPAALFANRRPPSST